MHACSLFDFHLIHELIHCLVRALNKHYIIHTEEICSIPIYVQLHMHVSRFVTR